MSPKASGLYLVAKHEVMLLVRFSVLKKWREKILSDVGQQFQMCMEK